MAFKNGYSNIFNVLFQMSWQLSKFVILKYILCYHIHLLYTLSNIWLIRENKYVCHPADSWSLLETLWRIHKKPLVTEKRGPYASTFFFFSREFVQGSVLFLLGMEGTYHICTIESDPNKEDVSYLKDLGMLFYFFKNLPSFIEI